MSCDNLIYHTAVDLDPCLCPELELGDYATADLERHTADRSRSKGHRQEVQSRSRPKISATCWTKYQKIRRAELMVSLVTWNGCGESYRPMANVFNARLRNTGN
jgi:hypothetical protein